MRKLMECVPNFSEGRDEALVEEIIDEVRKIEGITILDYSSDIKKFGKMYLFKVKDIDLEGLILL